MATKKSDAEKTSKTTRKATSATSKKAAAKKAPAKKTTKKAAAAEPAKPLVLRLIKNDKYLAEYAEAINGRHQSALNKISELTQGGKTTLSDFATGYLYFGLHKEGKNWILREWAPNATRLFLVGDFNKWQENEKFEAHRIEEHSIVGGFGSAVCEVACNKYPHIIHRIGVNDIFGESGPAMAVITKYGLDGESIARKVLETVK